MRRSTKASVAASKRGARTRKVMAAARSQPPSLRDLASRIEEVARAHPCWSQVHSIVLNCTDHLCAMARCVEFNEKEARRGRSEIR